VLIYEEINHEPHEPTRKKNKKLKKIPLISDYGR